MPELFERAWQNLAARPPTWRELMPDVVTLERDYFATEHGCLPSSLARAADALGTAGPLVVAMPCRTTVFATPLHKVLGSSVHAAALAQTVRRAYQQAGANRICPYLLATNERYVVNTVLEQVT
jgi:hypothetical protein